MLGMLLGMLVCLGLLLSKVLDDGSGWNFHGVWGRFLGKAGGSVSTSTSRLSSLLSLSLGLELSLLLDSTVDLESSLSDLLLSESAEGAHLVVIDNHLSESSLSVGLSLGGSNGGLSSLNLAGVLLLIDLGLLVLSIKQLLSDDRDEGFGFLDLLSGTDILRVEGGSFSQLNNFVFSGLKVLSNEFNICYGNSEVLLNGFVGLPDFVL